MQTARTTILQSVTREAQSLIGLGLLLGMMTGCASSGSKTTGSHAGVTIKGHDVTDVVLTTRDVFVEHGYTLSKAEPDRMIFERPGTKGDQLKYGSFGSPGVVIRVKVDIEEVGTEMFFLRCNVYAVRDAGDSVLEDESKIMMLSTKKYREIMDEIAAKLNDGGAGGTP